MENLPDELQLRIMRFLDHKNLATAQLGAFDFDIPFHLNYSSFVCRKWKSLGSEDFVWSHLFKERWGEHEALEHGPANTEESWKYAYEVENRCERFGRGVRIIREGGKYYFIMHGKIHRYFGTREERRLLKSRQWTDDDRGSEHHPMPIAMARGILDRIIFFMGDMETTQAEAKRARN